MDALELLKQDHQKVKDLFQQAEDAEGDDLEKICEQIKTELEMHAHIEETIFYPAMEKYDDLKEMVQESREEHQEIKTLLAEMARRHGLPCLSMGMSADYEAAIGLGATHVRVGTAIFGPRRAR
jgi:iron-sulfur cluster repair protein YtfE (RIC family)